MESKEMPNNKAVEQEVNQTIVQNEEVANNTLANNEANQEQVSAEEKQENNYSLMSEVELINSLKDILKASTVDDIRDEVELIKNTFYKKHNTQKDKEREAFLEEGGDIKDFVASNAIYSKDFKEILDKYRSQRAEKAKQREAEREQNLKDKYSIIEQIKGLIDKEESLNQTFNEFNELQAKWKSIGQVPQNEIRGLWDSYHYNVEKFYDYIRINKELRDLDFKKNKEAKTELCEKAEALLNEVSVVRASGLLQTYHEQWREIGPVLREERELLWNRFKEATSQVNKKHQDFFLKRKEEELDNLKLKEAICEKVEALSESEVDTHKQWDELVDEIKLIQGEWRKIGYAPKKDNVKIYERFCLACDKFFDKRREFYTVQKDEQRVNLLAKEQLCERAEALQNSTDWKSTTDELINLQKEWKTIGIAPRKQSDAVWKRFRAACDCFFNNKSEHFASADEQQEENLQKKNSLVEEVKAFTAEGDREEAFVQLKEFQQRWNGIGHVPFQKKDELVKQFKEAIDACYDKLKLDAKEKNLMKFKARVSEMSESSSQSKIRQERDRVVIKIKQLEKELATLERNVSFFGSSKSAEGLIKEVERKIENTISQIADCKEKLRLIDEVDA